MWIEPGTPCTSMSESISKSETNTYLSCYICNRSRCDSCHTMDTGITRTCCLVLIFNWALGMWKHAWSSRNRNQYGVGWTIRVVLPEPLFCFWRDLSKDLHHWIFDPHKWRVAIDPHALGVSNQQVRSADYLGMQSVTACNDTCIRGD